MERDIPINIALKNIRQSQINNVTRKKGEPQRLRNHSHCWLCNSADFFILKSYKRESDKS